MSAVDARRGDQANHDIIGNSLRETSSTLEDIARSVGYIVSCPVVFAVSIVGGALTFFCGSCCCSVMAHQAMEGGDSKAAQMFRDTAEKTSGCACCECFRLNVTYYNWCKPFQSIERDMNGRRVEPLQVRRQHED